MPLLRAVFWVAVSLSIISLWSLCFCLWSVAVGVVR